jgi:Swiss Army Knife RNA repair-like protein
MIPSSMVEASWNRRFPAATIVVLNNICAQTGAKIVFNTTHNLPLENVPDIEQAIVAHGLDKAHLHPTDVKTQYPTIFCRKTAVDEWLGRHPETAVWIALDDELFTTDSNLILVNGKRGLTRSHLRKAVSVFDVIEMT